MYCACRLRQSNFIYSSTSQNRLDMAGQPPPYSEQYAGYFKYTTPVVEQASIGPNSQNAFKHRYDVYIISSKQYNGLSGDEVDGVGSALYVQCTASSTTKISLTRFVPVRAIPGQHLALVEGYEDKGFITIPSCSFDDHSITKALKHNIYPHFLRDIDLPGSAVVRNVEASDISTPKAHLHKIDVFAESARLFHHTAVDTPSYVFNWSKPNSIDGGLFGLSGAWKEDFAEVLEDALWQAGKDIMILVRRVSEQQLEDLRARWRSGIRVLHFTPTE